MGFPSRNQRSPGPIPFQKETCNSSYNNVWYGEIATGLEVFNIHQPLIVLSTYYQSLEGLSTHDKAVIESR